MFAVIHALFGGLIGEHFNSVLFIVLTSLISHFFLDMIPHWDGGGFDKKFFNKTGMALFVSKLGIFLHVIDIMVCIVLFSFFYHEFHDKLMILGAFAAVFPDLAKWGYATKLKHNRHYIDYLKFHSNIQKEVSWKLGLMLQAVMVGLLLFAMIKF